MTTETVQVEELLGLLVTDVQCADANCRAIIAIAPDKSIGIGRQIRRAWFGHMRQQHPDEYAKLSPNFAATRAVREAEAILREQRKAEKYGLEAKRQRKASRKVEA